MKPPIARQTSHASAPDPMTVIILNDASRFPTPDAQYENIIGLFVQIAEHGGGQMITPLGTMDFDLSVSQGDALIIFKFDDIPVAVAGVV